MTFARTGYLVTICLLVATPLAAQSLRAAEPTAQGIEFFEKKIRPLLATRCYECLSSRAKAVKGGLRLDSRDALLAGGDSGPAIIPGDTDKSLLVQAVRYKGDQADMPPAGKLPDAEIALLTEWVARGAPFPAGGPAVTAKKPTIDFAAGRKHWAFQPLKKTAPPKVSDPTWMKRPIDAFILAALDARGLKPSPPADARTLVRRAKFDLVGLPPTVEEVGEKAYEAMIDQLLVSPHYGERWGRYWLDLVRYADVVESWAMGDAQAWPYRDWVVRALNDDVPYDQFVRLQLAADLLPGTKLADLPALGMLGLSPSYWKELKLDPSVIKTVVAEELEERINTVSSTLLGLTVACARCHDHKFDPVSTEDYYGLAGVLASTRLAERALLPASEAAQVVAARKKIKSLEEELKKLSAKSSPTDDEQRKLDELKTKLDAAKEAAPEYDGPIVFAVDEATLHVLPDGKDKTRLEYKPAEPMNMAVQIRGNPSNPGTVVPRRFLTVLSRSTPPKPFEHGSGRADLAEAVFTDAAPLAARVIVNRVWEHHFGRGLVDTPSNFGTQGSRPTHPELLDDLAARFVENGWRLKWLHREIMLSATYQQSSAFHKAQDAIDPDNRLLARMNRRRLEVEAWRDAMLFVTGRLDLTVGGPAVDLASATNFRRTLYGSIKRREVADILRLNDFPDPMTHSPARDITTTPLQQLFVLNSPFMEQQAAALVERVKKEITSEDTAARLRRAYQLLFNREPTASQLQLALDFLGGDLAKTPLDALWRQYAQALLASNEFLFVD
jgi:hypothetical protein